MDGEIVKELNEKVYKEKFGEYGCPRCNSNVVKIYRRTKDENQYEVYVCDECKIVLGRKMK